MGIEFYSKGLFAGRGVIRGGYRLFMKYKWKTAILMLLVFSYGRVMAADVFTTLTQNQRVAVEELRRVSSKDLMIKWNKKKGIVKFISGHLTKPSRVPKEVLALSFLERYKALFGIQDLATELEYYRSDSTAKGDFIHFKQKKQGLEVVGGKITLRLDQGVVTTVANYFEPNIPVVTVPTLSMKKAIAIARSAVGLPGQIPDAVLIILPWEENSYLAYQVAFQFNSYPEPSRYRVYVDAHKGRTLFIENRVMQEGPTIGTGIGVDGTQKTLDTYERGGIFYLGNYPISGINSVTLKTYTANNKGSLPGTILSDNDNHWEDRAGVDAHAYGNFTLDFYRNNFSNFSWYAGSGFQASGGLQSTVHYQIKYDNAFWNGRQVVYGDGDTIFYPLSGSLDVVAHEITHGITEAINSLIYCREPGTLNESWSDVMAMFVSIDYGDTLPYWIGEDIMKIASTPGNKAYYALRRMDDPSFRTDSYPENDYNPSNPLGSWGQPEHTSEQYHAACFPWTDNGGVHVNSGIPNKAAYLITINIGAAKAKQIYYHAMFYLSSNSLFVDARDAVEQATIDLYGSGSELSAVRAAFDTVGIW